MRGQARAAFSGCVGSSSSRPSRRPTKLELHRRARQADRNVRFEEVVRLARSGAGVRAITRETGLARNTVRRWLKDGAPPNWQKGERPGITDSFVPCLRERLAAGCRNATRLRREIRERGCPGRVITVRAWVRRLKADDPASASRRSHIPVRRRPTPCQLARVLPADAEPTGMDARFLAELRHCAEIDRAADAARAFVAMIRDRKPAALGPRLAEAARGPLGGVAESLRRDRAAVETALTLPWSAGPVEGKIIKLKLVKRSMYGRAGIDLLRQRLLAA